MPSRVIRGEILHSRSLARVSRDAANLFMRLTLAVDEFGRMDGRWRCIHAEVYGDRDDTSLEQVQSWINELCAEGCVEHYMADRDPVLRLPAWEAHRAKRNRAEKSKYPCSCGTYEACECAPHFSAERSGEKLSDAERSGLDLGLGSGVQGSGGHVSAPECADPAQPDESVAQADEIEFSPEQEPPRQSKPNVRAQVIALWPECQKAAGQYGATWRALNTERIKSMTARLREHPRDGPEILVHAVHGAIAYWRSTCPDKDHASMLKADTVYRKSNFEKYLEQYGSPTSGPRTNPPSRPGGGLRAAAQRMLERRGITSSVDGS